MVNFFAHRGFWNNEISAQNSIASLKASHVNKFYGVEFDVYFLQGKLVLKHDEMCNQNNLVNFANYFEFGNDFKYWIDFKNLNEANASEALSLVYAELKRLKIAAENIFIAPFITEYNSAQKVFDLAQKIFGDDLNFAAVVEKPEEIEGLLKFLRKNKIKFLSIFYQLINKDLLKELNNIELFPWTVNDLKQVENLEKLGIKNIITDQITPKIYDSRTLKPRASSSN